LRDEWYEANPCFGPKGSDKSFTFMIRLLLSPSGPLRKQKGIVKTSLFGEKLNGRENQGRCCLHQSAYLNDFAVK
jgi:hypothetical protein